MPELLITWPLALIYTLGFALAFSCKRNHWKIAQFVAVSGFITCLLTSIGAITWSFFSTIELDKLGMIMGVLVSLLGWVIVKYSHQYLQGDSNQARFVRAMLFTLTSVSLLVASGHLLVIAIAWTGTSIGLHYLLTHYQERKTAQIVAHKKFIASRLADICMVAALFLVYQATGGLTLDILQQHLLNSDSLSSGLHWAAALFALAAILKSAQLPLHGWLIQVMEAPTPVSALLHAGIVNIGGFVLLRLADLIALAPGAQLLLVIVGTTSAVLAGLVMMTRISIKVRLAWSTCAQMGFMLMEIGLGLYELALLHLLAHSAYKAHAFLMAGETVSTVKTNDFYSHLKQKGSVSWYVGAVAISVFVVMTSSILWQLLIESLHLPFAVISILSLGLASLLWFEQRFSLKLACHGIIRIIVLTQLYIFWHLLFAELAPKTNTANVGLTLWVIASFSFLYFLQIWVRRHPRGRIANTLFPWAYCGFYLDETFTRLTFKWWPARLNAIQAETLVRRPYTKLGESS